MTSDQTEEFKAEFKHFKDLAEQRWSWLAEFERAAYISGDVKLTGCVAQAFEALREQQEDFDGLEKILLEITDLT